MIEDRYSLPGSSAQQFMRYAKAISLYAAMAASFYSCSHFPKEYSRSGEIFQEPQSTSQLNEKQGTIKWGEEQRLYLEKIIKQAYPELRR